MRAAQIEQGLSPNPRAPFDVLLRRAAYVLTGLPPTAEQVARMRGTPDDATFASLVDELLASHRHVDCPNGIYRRAHHSL
ncbi:MAG: hypothetical protein RL398_265 [Planctomycetota bacterium]